MLTTTHCDMLLHCYQYKQVTVYKHDLDGSAHSTASNTAASALGEAVGKLRPGDYFGERYIPLEVLHNILYILTSYNILLLLFVL
jgi:hypothetical protein